MIKAIKVLENRIKILNKSRDKKEKQLEECEMVCDYTFIANDLKNILKEIIELQNAIEILVISK